MPLTIENMKKTVKQRTLQISLLISLVAQPVFLTATQKDQPLFPHFQESTLSVKDAVKKRVNSPYKSQLSVIDSDDADWEMGWDQDQANEDPNQDLETFFISSENSPSPSQKEFKKEEQWEIEPSHSPLEKSQENISSIQAIKPYVFQKETTKPAQLNTNTSPTQKVAPKAGSIPTAIGSPVMKTEPYLVQDIDNKNKVHLQATLEKKTAPTDHPSEPIAYQPRPSLGVSGPQRANKSFEKQVESTPNPFSQPSIRESKIIAQLDPDPNIPTEGQRKAPPKTILINFNNVNIIEYIRFISRITGKNFVFDEADLQFNVTIISEEPTTLENVITALIQELRIHGLSLIEQGNNLIIHRNETVNSISRVNVNDSSLDLPHESELVTQVFKLNTLDPKRASAIISPLLSRNAQIETSDETRHIIVTDLVTNIRQIEILFKNIDSPNSGLVIGQYVVRTAFIDTLIDLASKIMEPIAQDQPLKFVSHPAAKSVFVISTPFLVERTISVLQHLDQFQGSTRIYNLDELKFEEIGPRVSPPPVLTPETKNIIFPADEEKITPIVPQETPTPVTPTQPVAPASQGNWEINPQGQKFFRPGFPPGKVFRPDQLPQGTWVLDPQDNWYFIPEGTVPSFQRAGSVPLPEFPSRIERGGIAPTSTPFTKVTRGGQAPELLPGERPKGNWSLDPEGSWIFQLAPGEPIQPERITRGAKPVEDLPLGHIDRTKFFIHKLQYRKGEDIVDALQKIGSSLQQAGSANGDLVQAIQSAQWLEASNSIVFAGTDQALFKVNELVEEIDAPLRQVFIEMLILETTIDDSLTYGVSWATRSGGGNTSTAQAFLGGADPLVGALATGGISGAGEVLSPIASSLATTAGYHLGVIGQRITHNGTQFASIGALVTAIHQRSESNIVLNPKIITEDNKAAEIFVGINTAFQTQAVSNDEGSIITTNVEFRDVGTTLRVTPLIGNSNVVTLEIAQEVSRSLGTPSSDGSDISTFSPGPTTSVNRTTTTVHIPDEHFVIISGMIQDDKQRTRNQLPCLGGIPYLGALASSKNVVDAKRNLMIFIRPKIIDTDEQIRELTRNQQEIFKQKNRLKNGWKYEVEEGLDFLNVKPPCCDVCE